MDIRIIPASGLINITGSATMVGSGSISNTTIFSVNGNNGRLFEVTDDLSTSIFSANTIAGLPVIEAFADTSVNLGRYNSSGSAVQISSTGTLTATGDVVAYSDIRLKENIITIDNAVDKVLTMRGVYFNKKDDFTKTRKSGVIAQEMQKVLPEVVIENKDGILGVAYGNIVGVLIEAIKEQQQQIDELKYLLQTINK
jgi:hypothetical protein